MKTDTEVTTKIDWLGMSSIETSMPIFPDEFTKEIIATNPLRGYQTAYSYSDGRIVAQSEKIGTYVQYSGKCLNDMPMDALQIAKFHRERGFKPTRIDIAIDAKNSGLSINSLYKSIQLGEHASKSKNASIIDSVDGGKTLYVGSRQSEAFLRIYDKGIESRVGGDWVRIELELKGDKAINALNAMFLANDVNAFIVGAIRGFCDFPLNMRWNKIMLADKVMVKSDKQKGGDTRNWLMSQVVHAMAKTYKGGDTTIIEDFMGELARLLK